MCNFNSSSGVMQDIDSSWQCLMLPCRENKMHVKSNWIIIVQQVRKTGYSKRGEKQHAEEKKSQNRQKKNETAKVTFSVHVNLLNVPIISFFYYYSKSPLLYMYFIWYICISFVSFCWAYFYANIMVYGLWVIFYYAFSWCFFSPYVIYCWVVASSMSHPWLFVHVWIAVIPNFCMLT